ncbi:NAD(P)-binding protein [Panus rudis PR-1116 ss-1]|nr:NAD(P)-binding protein [Panus rudis PR-1116 ss-1]
MASKKLILVIGATGAQGLAVIDKLLAPSGDGSPSPYAVRALTRDPNSRRAKQLTDKGVECVKGSAFDDLPTVHKALEGVYGAWVNTDGFTVNEMKEVYYGIRIFELAKQAKTLRHYVWSNLDYGFKKADYNPVYRCEHYDGKGRIADWLKSQVSEPTDTGMSWTSVTTGPYMDMLNIVTFGPFNVGPDGTHVFATPVGNGHVPMIALSDLGYFARYTFDHRIETSGKDLEVCSDMVGWDYLVSTFQKVTGKKAVVLHQSFDEWFANFENPDDPVSNELRGTTEAATATSFRTNFTAWWSLWRDDIITRDLGWIRSIHPKLHTLESWMREQGYKGELNKNLLKNHEDGKGIRVNWKHAATL